MATKKAPVTVAASSTDPRTIVDVDGIRMALNPRGDVVVVQRKASGAYFSGDVHGMRPEVVPAAIARGEVSLHAISAVDVDDSEEDTDA